MTTLSPAQGRSAKEVVSLGMLVPLGGALFLLLLASLIPLRLDKRNFQDQLRASGLELPHGVPYLFVSRDTGDSARHFYGFALHNFAFPSPKLAWIVPLESRDSLSVAAGVDAGGRYVPPRMGEEAAASVENALSEFVADGVVLYDSEDARTLFLRRVPLLTRARFAGVLAPSQPRAGVGRRPASEVSLPRWLRMASMIGVASCLAGLSWRLFRGDAWGGVAATSLGVVLAGPVLVWMASWAQLLPLRAPGVWPFIAWGAAGVALVVASVRDGERLPATGRFVEMLQSRRAWAVGATLVITVFCADGILRLDFDEDAHSHWLLMARSYFSEGHHAPELLTQHVNSATYPYAYASLMALSAWAADTPPEQFYRINEPTAVAILLYRLGISALGLAALGLLAWALRSTRSGSIAAALCGTGLALVLFPILHGRHHAAETVLFPLLLAAIVLVEASLRLERLGLLAAGLFVAGSCTLVKLEGGLLVAVCVTPWLIVRWPGLRALLRPLPVLALLAGLLPTVVWKANLVVANEVYAYPSLAKLLARKGELPGIYAAAFTLLAREGWLLFLGVALPLAWGAWWSSAGSFREGLYRSAVPVSVLACVAGLPLIYVFSAWPPIWQLSTSYGRLLMPVLFGTLYYALLSVTQRKGGGALA